MKRSSIVFLQGVIVFTGLGALALLLWEPWVEGVNAQATTLREIYFDDPFLTYVYISSIAFFAALYQAFKLLRYIGQNEVFSQASVKTLRTIKYCAMAIVGLTVGAMIWVRIMSANNGDDSAGFMAIELVVMFISIVVGTAAAVFEKMLQSAVDIKSENDLTV